MKAARQNKIVEIVTKNSIETQEELVLLINKAGFKTTQATISRDIRELGITKVSSGNGRQKYAVVKGNENKVSDKFTRVLCDGFVSCDTAQNILVIKTVSGMAMAVAAAIDSLHIDNIVGCIAGDDTVMCAVRSSEESKHAAEKLRRLVSANKYK